MRCFFHLVSDSQRISDHVGIEAESRDEAFSTAIKTVEELRGEVDDADRLPWWLEVTDPADRVLFKVKLTVQRPTDFRYPRSRTPPGRQADRGSAHKPDIPDADKKALCRPLPRLSYGAELRPAHGVPLATAHA